MQTWSDQDAKARFSALLGACLVEGPQMVSKHGVEAAVLVPVQEWRRLQSAAQPSLKRLLLSSAGRTEPVIPLRGKVQRRNIEAAQ